MRCTSRGLGAYVTAIEAITTVTLAVARVDWNLPNFGVACRRWPCIRGVIVAMHV
jgi:hypothetical protein